jgi:hypothetical protein
MCRKLIDPEDRARVFNRLALETADDSDGTRVNLYSTCQAPASTSLCWWSGILPVFTEDHQYRKLHESTKSCVHSS